MGQNVLSNFRAQRSKSPPKRPSNTLSDYLSKVAQSYLDRTQRHAKGGLDMAEEGATEFRDTLNPLGFAKMVGGPIGAVMSPITALVPDDQEINAAPYPEWAKPGVRALSQSALLALPGPDFGPAVSSAGNAARRFGDDFATTFGVEVPEGAAVYGAGPVIRKPAGGQGDLIARLEAEAIAAGHSPSEAAEIAKIRARMRIFEDMPPVKIELTPERAAELRAEAEAQRAANPPKKYDIPPIEDFLPKKPRDAAPQAGGGAGQTPGPAEGIIAYHGSPHTFDKFDMSKIGTGEGAQAYGHGLYFAESPAVAKSYQEKLAQNNQRVAAPQPQPKTGNPFIDANAPILEPDPTRPGSMYQVRINAKPDEFLDWDRPLRELPRPVRDALESLGIKGDSRGNSLLNEQRGRDILDQLGPKSTTNADVAAKLKAAGIKGIRYKDAGSRGAEGGTYNYVIFDDKIIDILKRYGIPMTAGVGGAMVVSGQNMPPDIAAQIGPQG